jgi:hypothetical protein
MIGAVGLLVGAGVLAWQIRDESAPLVPLVQPAPGDASTAPSTASSTASVAASAVARAGGVQPTIAPTPPGRVGHTLDPCTAVTAPELPSEFQTLTIDNITIAWDPAVTLEPITLAYLTEGLLAQAALVTSTARRSSLAVVVYATLDDFRAQTHAPKWAGGLYDGAVRIPARASADFGLDMDSLRHELMHAQLHAGVGCMPAWLDEGLAQYFAREVPETEWLKMLSGGPAPSVAAMQVPAIEDVDGFKPSVAYAQSLAMVMLAIEHTSSIPEILRELHGGPPRKLWDRMLPGAGDRDVLEALSRRLFNLPLGRVAEELASGVCCARSGITLTCRGAHQRPNDRTLWFEDHEMCQMIESR